MLIPTKLSRVIKARDPKFQKEMERASALVTIAESRPTIAVMDADTAMPTMINAKDESCERRFANLKVRDVAASAPKTNTLLAALLSKTPTAGNIGREVAVAGVTYK